MSNTSIRLSPEGRAIEEALKKQWTAELGNISFTQVIERALRIAAKDEGLDVAAIMASAATRPAPARKLRQTISEGDKAQLAERRAAERAEVKAKKAAMKAAAKPKAA